MNASWKAGVTATIVAAALAVAGCATTRTFDTAGAREVTLAELRAAPEALAELRSLSEGAFVVKIPAGEVLPVRMIAQLPFATLEDGGGALRFSADTWLRLERNGAWLSPDGERWAAIHDMAAVKKLFGAERGSFSLGFAATRDEGPSVLFGVRLE